MIIASTVKFRRCRRPKKRIFLSFGAGRSADKITRNIRIAGKSAVFSLPVDNIFPPRLSSVPPSCPRCSMFSGIFDYFRLFSFVFNRFQLFSCVYIFKVLSSGRRRAVLRLDTMLKLLGGRVGGQVVEGSFSAVAKPIFCG